MGAKLKRGVDCYLLVVLPVERAKCRREIHSSRRLAEPSIERKEQAQMISKRPDEGESNSQNDDCLVEKSEMLSQAHNINLRENGSGRYATSNEENDGLHELSAAVRITAELVTYNAS